MSILILFICTDLFYENPLTGIRTRNIFHGWPPCCFLKKSFHEKLEWKRELLKEDRLYSVVKAFLELIAQTPNGIDF